MAGEIRHWLQRHRIGLRRAAICVVALYACYLLAANAFLNTRIGADTINRRPERFTAQWRWAMSLYPGHIYARGVLLRGHVRRIEWRVAGGSAHGRIQLLPLLRRQLRFGTIRGGTVDVDVDTGRSLMPPTPRRGAARLRKPWELVFEHIRSDQVRHLRLGEWRVDGDGAGDFSFYKQVSGGPMEIAPSQLHMRDATLRQGDTTWAQEAALDLDLALDRHIPARVQGMGKLELARAHLRLAGKAPSLRIVEAADGRLQVQRAGIGGRVEADLGIQHGTLDEGGYLLAVMPLLVQGNRAGAQGYGVDARIDVRKDAVAVHVHVPPQPRSGNRIDADMLLPGRQLVPRQASRLLDRAQGTVRLQWHFASLAWLNPMLSRGWLRLDGAADVHADLRIAGGRLSDGSTASIPNASVEADVQDTLIRGDASAQAKVAGGTASIAMQARRFDIRARAAGAKPYVQGERLLLDLQSTSELARFRDALQSRLRFSDARIPDLRAYNRYLPDGSASFLGGSGTLGGDLSLDATGKPLRAQLQLEGRRAAMQVGVSRIAGDLWLHGAMHRVSGTDYALDALRLRLDGVRLASAPADGPWWAQLSMPGGRLGWQAPLRLDGDASLQMKDVGILLALFAERSAFPKWVGKLIDEGQVTATSRVRVDGKSVVLDRLSAHNARVDLQARLRLSGNQPYGDLYARWGVLGLGVQLQGGKRDLHLVGAKRWYDSRPALLR